MDKYSAASKVFLLGEYAVLHGLPAIVAAVSPRFTLIAGEETPKGEQRFHSQSPISRLSRWAQKEGWPKLSFTFEDPLKGAGGFGASTAQFAMGYLAYAQKMGLQAPSWANAWGLYRELMKDDPVVPSGADLVGQWQGGVSFFHPAAGQVMSLWDDFDWSLLLVFSATQQPGRKVQTHEHLAELPNKMRSEASLGSDSFQNHLKKLVTQGLSAIRENHLVLLGQTFDEYAKALASAGLELPATHEDRHVLRQVPGVLGVKGAGALQADAILVLMQPESTGRDEVIRVASERGLKLISDGLKFQAGVTCHKE